MNQDPRRRWKVWVREKPLLAKTLQFLFDPAYTPRSEITRWIQREEIRGVVLNFGSGSRICGSRVINLDYSLNPTLHIVSSTSEIPFKTGSVDAILLEYVLEHIPNPTALILEIKRVLKPGGRALFTVPWQQNYHGCPGDFTRWSHEGLRNLLAPINTSVDLRAYGGPASSWVDSTKEFLAQLCSFGNLTAFGVLSQLWILPLIPIKYLDIFLRRLPTARFTAFSFIVGVEKPGHFAGFPTEMPIEEVLRKSLGCRCGFLSEVGTCCNCNLMIKQEKSIYSASPVESFKTLGK